MNNEIETKRVCGGTREDESMQEGSLGTVKMSGLNEAMGKAVRNPGV